MARPRERNGDAGRDRARGEVTGHGWKVDFVFSQKFIFKKKIEKNNDTCLGLTFPRKLLRALTAHHAEAQVEVQTES